jgi:hypothetical protein
MRGGLATRCDVAHEILRLCPVLKHGGLAEPVCHSMCTMSTVDGRRHHSILALLSKFHALHIETRFYVIIAVPIVFFPAVGFPVDPCQSDSQYSTVYTPTTSDQGLGSP